jgi:general secretion pathway protein I
MSAHGACWIGQRARRAATLPALAGHHDASSVRCSSHRQGGFTLLEVIAAIMLLAIAFTALMKVAGASIALTQNAATRSAAAMWARSKLDSEFVTAPLQVGHSAGRFDRQFAWQLEVAPWADAGTTAAGSLLRLYRLDLDVSWGPVTRRRSAHFRTLRLATAQPGAAAVPGEQP